MFILTVSVKKKKKKRNVAAINFLDFPFIVYVPIFPSIIPAPPLVNLHDLFKAGLLYLPPKLDLSLTVKLLSFSLWNIAKHNKKKIVNLSSFQYILLFMLSRSFYIFYIGWIINTINVIILTMVNYLQYCDLLSQNLCLVEPL